MLVEAPAVTAFAVQWLQDQLGTVEVDAAGLLRLTVGHAHASPFQPQVRSGGRGIRTLEELAPLAVFKTAAIGH